MTREIKFRAWNPIQNMMMPCGSAYSCKDGVLGEYETDNEDGEVLMQFTGLKDKNGTEIYEGDVVKHHFKNWIIEWKGHKWALVPTHIWTGKHTQEHNLHPHPHTFEVIGNVYENPELLIKK